MPETIAGREPIQIVEIKQPLCTHVFGEGQTNPDPAPDVTLYPGDTPDGDVFDRSADLTAIAYIDVPAGGPSGCLWEQGGATNGVYLGFTNGQIVFRVGDGSPTTYANNTAMIRINLVDFPEAVPDLKVVARIIMPDKITLGVYRTDAGNKCVVYTEATSPNGKLLNDQWAGVGDGTIGGSSSRFPNGEDGSDYNGTLDFIRFWGDVYEQTGCHASAGEPCYNTRGTCQSAFNYALGDPLSLYFWTGKGDVSSAGISYAIPSLVSVSTSPTRINLAGANPDAKGLGNRALCRVTFQDHEHSDRVVDPYVSERSWNPLDPERGSFWTRWLVRNKYRQNIVIVVHEGYAGQTLAEMTSRQYFLTSVSGPDSSGRVIIEGKDILARIEERKAQVPVASPGVLYTAITAAATSFEVANAIESEYDASGTLRIGDEIMTYTGVATSTNGITFSGVTRGTDGTTAKEHDVDETVQQGWRLTNATIADAYRELLEDFGGIDAGYLDTSGWATEAGDYLSFYRLTGLITEPTGVDEIVSSIQVQTLTYLWWDERDRLVKMRAIRGIDAEPPTLTDEYHIISGSFSLSEKPRERISRVYVHYAKQDFTAGIEDAKSYRSRYIVADLESETEELYGEKSIRNVYAPFLLTESLAANTATKILTRYVDTPSECTFLVDAKDREYWVGSTFYISHYLDRDQFGARRTRLWTVIAAEETVPGEQVRLTCADTTLYGRIHYIMATGASDYPGADAVPFKNCYIGDAAGLLSDGNPCGRIS